MSPGEADIRATFQSFAVVSHARVFAPSAVVRLTFDGPSSCSPADHLDVVIRAALDDGTLIQKPTVTWRSSAPTIVVVEPDGRIACKSPGDATLEVTYQGQTASKQVTVRITGIR